MNCMPKAVSILGAGTMGPCIAQVFAMHECRVRVWSRSEKTREQAKNTLRHNLDTFVGEGELTYQEAEEAFANVVFCETVEDAVSGAELVLETIVEDRAAKIELYKTLEALLSENVILASNTSALNPFELIPENMLPRSMIMHWYTPAQLVPLVDVVKSEQMSDEVCESMIAFLRKCGKVPVAMKKFINGYIVNRMQICLNQEIFYLLDNGYCAPEDIDLAVKASFIPRAVVLGMCRRMDFNGLDMAAKHYINRSYVRPPDIDMPQTLVEHMNKGELGLKSGKGFYDYTDLDKNDLLAKRDKQLFEIYRTAKRFMDDPV